MSEFVYHSNKEVEDCLTDYQEFLNSLDRDFPDNPNYVRAARAWLDQAQTHARNYNAFLVSPSVAKIHDAEGGGIILFWDSNPGLPFNHHHCGFLPDGKAGYYIRNFDKIQDYSNPEQYVSWNEVPFTNTVMMFSIEDKFSKAA